MSLVPTPYGDLASANTYMKFRLGTEWWFDSIVADREAALIMATRAIDRLNYAGDKNDPDQTAQFPRGNDTEVPEAIECACYECAFKYLCGSDIEDEIRGLGMDNVQISGARTSSNAMYVPEHLRAGIVSAEAWMYLRPYLRDPYCSDISRG